MKQITIFFLIFLSSFLFAGTPDYFVEKEIQPQMQILIDALNNSDEAALSSLVGTNATETVKGIPARLKGNTIKYTTGNPTYELIDTQHVKVTWKVSSDSIGVNGHVSITGLSHNVIFEKQGDTWKIIDGSFDPTSLGSVGWIFGLVFGVLGLIFIPLGILWIFMLIHAAKHDVHNKTTWIILMCLIGIPVSIIYFFTERKRFNTSVIPNSIPPTTVV